MLNIQSPGELAALVRTPLREMLATLRRADHLYSELTLSDPCKPGKERIVFSARGLLRMLQSRLYEAVLLARLDRSPYSHGGVPGRSILTNVRPHLGQAFVFTTDVSNFFPSIHCQRVLELLTRLGCSEEVAGICTRLCTVRHRLAQGIITSPILADQLMRPVDERIAALCHRNKLIYTRFVDDIAISGPSDLVRRGFPSLVQSILCENGFGTNPGKDQFGSASEGVVITGVRFPNGHPDVRKSYLDEAVRQLRDAVSLGEGGPFDGPYYTEDQIRGRVRFISWVNPRRRRPLHSLLRRIDWLQVRDQARVRGLEVVAKRSIST